MTTDFETHPIGTGKRLDELEGLVFARRRTEYTRPVTDEDADAARRAFHADGCSPWGDATPSIRVRWRRVAEAVRDRLSGREMVAEPTYHDGYETGRRDEAQAQSAMRIAPRDVRVGDVLAITYTVTVTGQDDEYNISTDDSDRRQHNLHAYNASARLLDRPDPDAERAEQLRDALIAITGAPPRHFGNIGTDEIRAALKAAGLTIEPAAKEADRA